MNIKDIVRGTTVEFVGYCKGNLWYRIGFGDMITYTNFGADEPNQIRRKEIIFPVPIEDTGDGVFPAKIKAISLMRYVRKHIKSINDEKTM